MRFFSLLCAGALAASLAGCGGGSNPLGAGSSGSSFSAGNTDSTSNVIGKHAAGRATFTIHWHATRSTSRLVPSATQSLKIDLVKGSALITSKTVTAPAGGSGSSTVSFDNLDAGSLHVVAAAFASADATGTALATGTTDVAITSGQVTNASLTLNSTIDHISVSYTGANLLAGETAAVTVTAYDAAGDVVLLPTGVLAWISSDATKASVASTTTGATLTGVGAGTTTITVTDTESHVSKTFDVLGMTFSLTPIAPAFSVGGAQTFTGTVAGLADNSATYSLVDANGAVVANGAGNGSIDAQGNYTAPTAPGTYYVRATSVGDSHRFVTATVTIQAGNAAISVQ